MKINVITGGTGFIGRYLVHTLLKKNQKVWVIVRENTISSEEKIEKIFPDYKKKYKNNFVLLKGDISKKDLGLDKSTWESLSGNEIMYWHLAANLSFLPAKKNEVLRTNIEGTKNIVELANKTGGKLLYMSTAYVCGDKKEFGENELEQHQHFRNVYEESKYEAEKIIRSKCKIPFFIFRPSIAIGNAYEGKAAGCTFGYYRYIFLFYLLKTWIRRILEDRKSFRAKILRFLNTSYNPDNDVLHIPWLLLPYPLHSTVDLIPVDYIIDSIINIAESDASSTTTFNLTNPNPPSYEFLLRALVDDLGIKDIRHIGVSKHLFVQIFKLSYILFPSVRSYIKSLTWYLPYITYRTHFSQSNIQKYSSIKVPAIDREFVRRVNKYAKHEVFQHITID